MTSPAVEGGHLSLDEQGQLLGNAELDLKQGPGGGTASRQLESPGAFPGLSRAVLGRVIPNRGRPGPQLSVSLGRPAPLFRAGPRCLRDPGSQTTPRVVGAGGGQALKCGQLPTLAAEGGRPQGEVALREDAGDPTP